jgi:hypothetical protein
LEWIAKLHNRDKDAAAAIGVMLLHKLNFIRGATMSRLFLLPFVFVASQAFAWQLTVADQACQLSQQIKFTSDNALYANESFEVSFVIAEQQQIEFSIASVDSQSSVSLPSMMFADGQFDSEGEGESFHLKHSSSRDLFLLLSDFSKFDTEKVDLSVTLDSQPDIVFTSQLDSDVLEAIKSNRVCFDRLTQAISKI